MSEQTDALGGYLGLELPQPRPNRLDGAQRYQSAQGAFLALLASLPSVERVWMPTYICDVMPLAVRKSGRTIVFYHIGPDLAPVGDIEPGSRDILVYVNYFGVCDAQVLQLLEDYDRRRVVIDCAQALFAGPYDCLATLFSPRKFLGIPDGGLMVTSCPVARDFAQDETSVQRMAHLIQRVAFSAEAGYDSFKAAEAELESDVPQQMSRLTERLLSSINFDVVRDRRMRNFKALHSVLGHANRLALGDQTPAALCYPFLATRPVDRRALAVQRVYLPCYWPEVAGYYDASGFEIELSTHLAALPCDQRYDPEVLLPLARRIKDGYRP